MRLLLDVSAVSVVIVIIAICDMPRQEFSLCERVYIHNTYMESGKSCSETRRKFRVRFPGRPVPNPSTIRRQAKIFKETGSVKNRKVNRRHHVLTEETLDEIGERLKQTLPKISKTFINKQINMEGRQSGTYLRLTRASSSPWVSVAETYRDETKRK